MKKFSEKEILELNSNGIIVDEVDVDSVVEADGRWRTNRLTLTPEIVEQLKQGKVWAFSDGEYTTLIRLGGIDHHTEESKKSRG